MLDNMLSKIVLWHGICDAIFVDKCRWNKREMSYMVLCYTRNSNYYANVDKCHVIK